MCLQRYENLEIKWHKHNIYPSDAFKFDGKEIYIHQATIIFLNAIQADITSYRKEIIQKTYQSREMVISLKHVGFQGIMLFNSFPFLI